MYVTDQGSTDQNRSVPEKNEKSWTRPDQDLKGLRNLGPTRTRNKYFPKISDQLGPGPNIFGNHGPTRTRTKYFRKSRTSSDRDQNLYEILSQLGPGPKFTDQLGLEYKIFADTASILDAE